MTTKRYLSEKKTTSQNIAISPALKDWIERYVKSMQKKHPEDERYKSISAFYCSVMESVLNSFEKGKTLDDFERLVTKNIDDFYNKMSFKAFIPHFEKSVEMNRYTEPPFNSSPLLLLKFFRSLMKSGDFRDTFSLFENFKSFMLSNNLTKDLNMDTDLIENKGIIEYIGNYENLHFDITKAIAGILGAVGFKLGDFLYIRDDKYSKFEFLTTDLVLELKSSITERKKLFLYNVHKILNYFQILNDKPLYLWMKLAKDNELFINFKNENARDKWLRIIEQDIKEFAPKEEVLPSLLRFFEKINWISIKNPEEMSFQIELSHEKYKKEIDFMLEYLSNHGELIKEEELYYLKS